MSKRKSCPPSAIPFAKKKKVDLSLESATKIVENEMEILKDSESVSEVLPSLPTKLRISKKRSALDAFRECLPTKIWDILVDCANMNLHPLRPNGKRDSRRRETYTDEMIRWYALLMLIEQTYYPEVKNIAVHFKQVKEGLEKKGISIRGMGYDRFERIKSALKPNNEQLKELCLELGKAALSQIKQKKFCAVDVSLFCFSRPSGKKTKQY
jgi:hypothetical protein